MPENTGDTAWIMTCGALVLFMTPGLAFFYAGGSINRENIMHAILMSLLAFPVVTLQWFIWGYSIAFSPTGCLFIGDMNYVVLNNVAVEEPHPLAQSIPPMVFCFYESAFAIVTGAILYSGAAERMRVLPFCILLFVWTTLVYDVLAYWAWAPHGWWVSMGGYDTAGGLPVEMASGISSLAIALALGPRKQRIKGAINAPLLAIGAGILWFGWIGFNAGSLYNSSTRAGVAAMNTNLSAIAGAGVWYLIEYWYHRKSGVVAFCGGAVAGLVAITPAASHVQPWAALVIGAVAGACCWGMSKWRKKFVDDSLDAFAVHGTAGIIGLILVGVFADKDIQYLDSNLPTNPNKGGWVSGNFVQVPIQLAGVAAGAAWAFGITFATVKAMQMVYRWIGKSMCYTEQDNIDEAELGESALHQLHPNKEFSHKPVLTIGQLVSEIPHKIVV